ncbi:hypothetical protein SAMN05660297_01680 [Natronincola peptidivorans]|uniref:PH domain-containing protein n=1 Tax=Natronincola peptidivorans TaxID=426128 RepID=A0A1I0CK29_9FIRM|nr:hypothetical protein SAMN05660297_01680 [Natronincola peptidivorans]
MTFLKTIGRTSLTIFRNILLGIGLVLIPILSGLIMSIMQSLVFVPEDFIMWSVGNSVPSLALIFFIIMASILVYYINTKKHSPEEKLFITVFRFVRRHRKATIAALLGFSIIIGYYMFTNVSVISNDRIVTHSFFHPQGKEYSYTDIEALHTGLYNKTVPFTSHQKGEFYYIIELKDGKKINLEHVGGVKNHEDSWLTFMKLDQIFTKLDVTKNIDAEDVDFYLNSLDPLYRNRIQSIFSNVK